MKRKKTTPEGALTKQVRELFKHLKIFHWKQFQTLGSKPGVSDIIGIRKIKVSDLAKAGIEEVGVFFALELKAPGKKPNDNQEEFLECVRQSGGLGYWASSIEDVISEFGLKYKKKIGATIE